MISKTDFSIDNSRTIVQLSIEVLIEKVKKVGTENGKFEYQDNSLLEEIFGTLVLSGL